jgi:hypothetical protein
MNKNFFQFFSLTTAAMVLSSCETFKDTFGLNHYQADEFKVSDNPPLSVPRDYSLRAPDPANPEVGSSAVAKYNSSKEAHKTLLGRAPEQEAPKTVAISSEKSLISSAQKEQQTDPNIRKVVNDEAKVAGSPGDKLADKLSKMGEQIKSNATNTGDNKPSDASVPVTPATEEKK